MAGTYPDPPGPRIAYDRDGTVLFTLDSALTVATEQANSVNISLNDELESTAINVGTSGYLLFLFPQAMDVSHWAYWTVHDNAMFKAQYSTNSTNGIDGTWVDITKPTRATNKATLRTNIQAIAATNVVALRLQRYSAAGASDYGFKTVHLYGKPSAVSDRLEFWHPTLDQPLSNTPAYFDYGDVARGAGAITKDFRLKNLSTSLTANTITVGSDALTDATPTYVSQTDFRYNGGSYASTATLGSLAPNTVSNVFTVRLTTTASSQLSLWSQRYYASASNWS